MPIIATRLLFAISLICSAVVVGISPSWAAGAADSAAAKATAPAPASKLPADQALHDAMESIANLLDKQGAAIDGGKLAGQAYKEISTQVDSQLAAARNSKLAPKSEKAWLAIQADMKHGLELMRGEKPELQRAGALALIQAVRNYGKHFDHPGLKL